METIRFSFTVPLNVGSSITFRLGSTTYSFAYKKTFTPGMKLFVEVLYPTSHPRAETPEDVRVDGRPAVFSPPSLGIEAKRVIEMLQALCVKGADTTHFTSVFDEVSSLTTPSYASSLLNDELTLASFLETMRHYSNRSSKERLFFFDTAVLPEYVNSNAAGTSINRHTAESYLRAHKKLRFTEKQAVWALCEGLPSSG